jgi:hypothetical protein
VSELDPFNFKLEELVNFEHIQNLPKFHFSDDNNEGIHDLDLLPTLEPVSWENWQVPHAPAVTAGGVVIICFAIAIIILCCCVPGCRQCFCACAKRCTQLTFNRVRKIVLPTIRTTPQNNAMEEMYEFTEYNIPTKKESVYSQVKPVPAKRQEQIEMVIIEKEESTQQQTMLKEVKPHPLYPSLGKIIG